MKTTDEPIEATPEEQAAAEALAEALDGGPADAVDREALGAAGFLDAHDRFGLSDDRFAAVRDRIGAEIGDAAPKRRLRWLWIAAPALAAAAALVLIVLPSQAPQEARPASGEQYLTVAPESSTPVRWVMPPPPAPPAPLLEAQKRVIVGDTTAEAEYQQQLAAYRASMLVETGGK